MVTGINTQNVIHFYGFLITGYIEQIFEMKKKEDKKFFEKYELKLYSNTLSIGRFVSDFHTRYELITDH